MALLPRAGEAGPTIDSKPSFHWSAATLTSHWQRWRTMRFCTAATFTLSSGHGTLATPELLQIIWCFPSSLCEYFCATNMVVLLNYRSECGLTGSLWTSSTFLQTTGCVTPQLFHAPCLDHRQTWIQNRAYYVGLCLWSRRMDATMFGLCSGIVAVLYWVVHFLARIIFSRIILYRSTKSENSCVTSLVLEEIKCRALLWLHNWEQ